MRFSLILTLMILPSLASAQIQNPSNNGDELVSKSRLGKLAKKLADEKSPTTNSQTDQVQSVIQNTGSAPNTYISPNSSSKSTAKTFSDFALGQETSLDVAGITIGMSPEQVKQTLAAKGYELTLTEKASSFDELVKIRREGTPLNKKERAPLKSAIGKLEFKKQHETLKVDFLSLPSQVGVYRIAYRGSHPALTVEEIRHLFKEKYGWDETRKRNEEDFKLRSRAGLPNASQVYENSVASQITYYWFNRKKGPDSLGNPIYRRDDAMQGVKGSISNGPKILLSLAGEAALETFQEDEIRARMGTASTTF